MSRELRYLQEFQLATKIPSRRGGGYSEAAKENMKVGGELPKRGDSRDKEEDNHNSDDEDDDVYVPLSSSRRHRKREESTSTNNNSVGIGSRRRMTRNSNTSSGEATARVEDEDVIRSCKVVLNSSRRNNIQVSGNESADSEADDEPTNNKKKTDRHNNTSTTTSRATRCTRRSSIEEKGHENERGEEDESDDDVDYEEGDEDDGLHAPSNSSTEEGSNGEEDDEDEPYYLQRGLKRNGSVRGDEPRRRSTRPRSIRQGTYNDTYNYNHSWLVGGGGEAKGYFRSSRSSSLNRVSRRGGGDDGLGKNGGDAPRSQSSSVAHRRHLTVEADNDDDDDIPSCEENGHVPVTDDNDGQDDEDMYSRVKKRHIHTRSKPKSTSTLLKKSSQLELNEEPVCRRLRDRKKLVLSRTSAASYGYSESEPKLNNVLRKKRHHKRRRNRSDSNSSSSSSSSTDSDDTQVQSPSKKKLKRKFNVPGTENLKGHGLVARKELKMLMEVQPIAVDPSITFKSVGGLGNFIDKLKEIVLFPLLYHEFYEGRGMSAPKGILLHGPPGTGKTLLARALSNECSNINGRKVSFFLRKGADLLNKFVGESERQLRMLFQQAALHQPSIIFFDEIDGLAPVRSAKSDQIHNSIVSSLLAEIDGLQDRGQIIVMGSTNRLDFVDPALRRPGRFDCELPIFLPTRNGRREILEVHVSKWKDSPTPQLLDELADRSIGFNGADLKFLCWQSTMNSLRRTYPQIYGSSQKYLLNYDSIKMDRDDWEEALKSIAPSTQRSLFSTYSPAQPLPAYVHPLLRKHLKVALAFLEKLFPHESISLLAESSVKRCLIHGEKESGLNTFVIPALLHAMEKVPVYVLSFEALHMDGGNAEFSVTQKCMEVMKQPKPCICYLPDFERLCDLLSDSCKEIMIRMLNQSLQKPILFLATVEGELSSKFVDDCDLMTLFKEHVVKLPAPSEERICLFFQPVFDLATKVKRVEKQLKEYEELPFAPAEAPPTQKLNEEQIRSMEKQENSTFRELRIFLRQILTKMARNKKFEEFTRPVDIEEVPDYLEVIPHPMDFEAMMFKLNSNFYFSAKEFLEDINLIYSNCLAYNPHKTESDKRLRMRAFELKDYAEKLIEDEMDSDFERECHKIIEARTKRDKDNECGNGSSNSKKNNNANNPPDSARSATGQEQVKLPQPSSSNDTATPITINKNRIINGSVTTGASNSRPTSANRTKKRRASAWSKGTVPKKLKRPTSAGVGSSAKKNLEKKSFSQLSESLSPTKNGSCSEMEEDLEVDVVGNDNESEECSPECQEHLAEQGSGSPTKLRTVPRISQSSSSEQGSPPGLVIPSSAGVSSSSGMSSPAKGGITSNDSDGNMYLCKNASELTPKFRELLNKTTQLCKRLSIVKLVDIRFQILRLVTKHQSCEVKNDLYRDLKTWLKDLTTSMSSSGGDNDSVVSSIIFPAPSSFTSTTASTSGLNKYRHRHNNNHHRAHSTTSTTTSATATTTIKVKVPASSAPPKLRFNGLERSQKRWRQD